MSEEADFLSKFLDLDQYIRSAIPESGGDLRNADANANQWYAAGTAQWYSAHIANNFSPVQIIPYHQPPPSVAPAVYYRPCQAEALPNAPVACPRILYVLNASTSPATKFTEEPITFLNQGQSYEIQIVCGENLFQYTSVKSVIRVLFNDRRLQYMEKEQLQLWKQERHPTEKLIELDIPLCYGVTCLKDDPGCLNCIQFLWDHRQKAAVCIKLNCVSTEFTVKKCGGEKGIPFRIQVDTYGLTDAQESGTKLIHSAFCLVKVFKPKGAERKLKNDMEWISRLLPENKKCYRPAQEKTIFIEMSVEEMIKQENTTTSSDTTGGVKHSPHNYLQNPLISTTEIHSTGLNVSDSADRLEYQLKSNSSLTVQSPSPNRNNSSKTWISEDFSLNSNMTPQEVVQWMKINQFDCFINVLSKFTGADLLRLSRNDFIDICGVAEGIRFSNSVLNKSIRPKLSLYICTEPLDRELDFSCREAKIERQSSLDSFVLSPASSLASSSSGVVCSGGTLQQSPTIVSLSPSFVSPFPSSLDSEKNNSCFQQSTRKRLRDTVDDYFDSNSPALKRSCSHVDLVTRNVYNLVNLDFLTRCHLIERLSPLFGLRTNQIYDVYLRNAKGLMVEITDLVVEYIEDESHFKLEAIHIDGGALYTLLLKSADKRTRNNDVLI